MAAVFPSQVSALQVGSYFVGQYYILLQQDPSLVHKFYSDTSTMNRFDGLRADGATGMMQIHNLITRLNYSWVEIKSAHSIESWNGGILVMVSGSIQTKEHFSLRKFAQTFFLAPQENGYFVLNDVFQFVDDDQVLQHPKVHPSYESTIVAHNPITRTVGEGTQKNYGSPVVLEQTETVDKYSIHDPPQNVVQSALNLNTIPTDIARDPPLTPEQPVGESAKHTYASILRVAKTHSGQSSPPNAPLNKASNLSSDLQLAQQDYQRSQSAKNVMSEKANLDVVQSADIKDEGEQKSVYVGNLPSSITTSQLEQEFKKFGVLKPEGIVIRSRKETGAFFAFIEFADATGVMNAIKASPVQISDRLVRVEERRYRNSSYHGGRRGRGRTGYRHSEAPRRKYGNRFYGGGGYENNNRGYSNRSRGRGYHQRIPNQEIGISSNQNQSTEHEQIK